MKTKQQIIEKAWGLNYNEFKDFIDEDGWGKYPDFQKHEMTEKIKPLEFRFSDFRPLSLHGIENNNGWIKVEDVLPDEGREVVCFNKAWINEDFNPKGIRIGFLNGSEWTTAHYWNYQDTYVTISHSYCDNDEEFSDEIRESIDPTHYRLITDKPPIY
ncbi:hypothetical protein C1637_09835 [Chryseobacterium lactis]|uniref:SMI1/KNR4 family protein n=1 Tax=Chryseobacterium lactis TaxID=1241981 RepID=A0A3G6RM19_CHRLC|nr:hypothetical protein [Chryseobacterium lactis]AZA82189.1 hypothetical protein EG342_09865 [Chryseobacterium lactis]AZB02570.1 hypothetical protein EG341_00720 [Chryseobacterium lactis]PNW14135.1 hypothetical protein C1637_09835 [Chryseobacterium lactis]